MNSFKSFLLGSTVAVGFAAVGVAFVPAAALAQTSPAPAAQPAADDADTEVESIVVVGSRIRRDNFNSASPVQIITRDETTLAGYDSTTEALQGTAVTGGGAQINNAFGGFVTDGGPGANTISLRGLGEGRTLVLINGRRVAPAGTRGAVGSADLNVLPSAIIDHTEILRDGASSIYGSDAIAGVINVVTQSNLNGVTFEGQVNHAMSEGGDKMRLSVVGGLTRDRWSFSGSAEYYERGELTLGDRDWTRCNMDYRFNRATGVTTDFIDPLTGEPKCYPITSTGSNGVTINTIGTNTTAGVGAPGSVGSSFNRWRPNSAVTTGLVGFEGVGGGANNLNVRDTFDPRMMNNSLISPVQIFTAFGQASYDLQALGNAELYGELLVNERNSHQTGFRQLSLDYMKNSTLIPAGLAASTFTSTPTAISNGQPVGVRAFIGFGNYTSEQSVEFYKGTAGVRGDFTPLDGWRYDVTLSYAKSNATYGQQTWLTDRVAASLNVVAAPVGTPANLVRKNAFGVDITCASNIGNPAASCVPAPVLNSQTIGGILPRNWVDYTFTSPSGNEGRTIYEETILAATLDGAMFELPAGDVMGAFGLEYRKAEIDDTPSIASQTGNLYNLTSAAVTRGTDSVMEAYGEVEVPLLKDAPLAHELTLNLSARYTDYDSYGSDWTYKLGGVYAPVDWISLRATYGTSFRAPALFEQFQGATSGFLSSSGDPCNNYGAPGVDPNRAANCASELPGNPTFTATSSIQVLSAGGAAQGLEAETSDNFTVGLILQPHLPEVFGEFAFAIDYYDIEINNGVSKVGASSILQLCYDDPQFRAGGGWCNFVNPRAAGSNALTVNDVYTNIATQIVEGIDYNVRWTREIGPGDLRVNATLTQYKSQASKLFSTDALDEYNGSLNTPEYTGTFDATYSFGAWRVRYGFEWIDGMESYTLYGLNRATTPYILDVDDYFLHHASVQYRNDDWSATFGVRNLSDEEPPMISSGVYNRVGNAPLYSGYDYVGRQLFLNVSRSF